MLYMRGLPFDCNDDDIKEFFKPLEVIRTQVSWDEYMTAEDLCNGLLITQILYLQ